MRLTLISFCAIVALCSCGSKNSTNEAESTATLTTKAFKLVGKGTKSFPLDFESAVDITSRFRLDEIEGKEYFSFSNPSTKSINIYDYEKGEQINKLKLANEGPNAINLLFSLSFFPHSLDSIFISGFQDYYLVNSKAEVLKKLYNPKEQKYRANATPVYLMQATSYRNGKLIGPLKYSLINKGEGSSYFWGTIDLNTAQESFDLLNAETFIPNYGDMKAFIENSSQKLDPLRVSFAGDYTYLVTSTGISDSIYFIKSGKLVKTALLSSPDIEITDYKTYLSLNRMEQLKNEVQTVSEPIQPPHFAGLYLSPNKKFVYRILINKTRGEYVENLEKEMPRVQEALLLVYNTQSGETSSIALSVEELSLSPNHNSNAFASNAGLHILIKEQASENRVDFRVFGVED